MPKRRKTEYSESVADAEKNIDDIDRHRCHYTVDGMRCTALGVICETAQWDENVKDPNRRWLCMAHYKLRNDPLGSREVVRDLAMHSPKRPEDWREKMLLEHGVGELQTAWRDMSPEEKQTLIHETIRTIHSYRLMTPEQRSECGREVA
jgi:hypothetical protein